MQKQAFILDLDDTIFRTKSMDPKVFTPFFDHLTFNLSTGFDKDTINNIINDLWQTTWDKVIDKYKVPIETFANSIKVLDSLDMDLNIEVYPDYYFLKNISAPKYLVTTSLTSLQVKKIRALGIEKDFDKIIINDTFIANKTKYDIFAELVKEFSLIPEHTFVIGDNPDSEIKAGNAHNMVTIQMLREGVIRCNSATHYIRSFEELQSLLK